MSFFLHVLTPKGLRYLLYHHRDNIELMHAVRHEIKKRGLLDERTDRVRTRERDGYERDQ